MTLGSLFDGSGTCPLTATMVGITPVWASEIEPFPRTVTTYHFPDMKHLGDVKQINGAKIDPVDVITFGSPCQNLSIAGKREGLSGKESSLFLEAVRIIKEMRDSTNEQYPKFAVWENVYGAFSSAKGDDFKTVLEKLGQICESGFAIPRCEKWQHAGFILGNAFSIAWRGLDAQYWGVPQRRKRIYLVADFRGQRAAEILFKRESLPWDYRTGYTPGQETTPNITESTNYCVEHNTADARYNLNDNDIVQTLCHKMGTGGGNVPMIVFQQARYDDYTESEKAATIKSSLGNYGGGSETLICEPIGLDLYSQDITGGVAMTIATKADPQHTPCVAETQTPGTYRIRRLTPTECAALQGFPKDWAKPISHSDTAEYKMWGNGMALPCMLYVIEGIAEILKEGE